MFNRTTNNKQNNTPPDRRIVAKHGRVYAKQIQRHLRYRRETQRLVKQAGEENNDR
jgi:hypothetical protein